MWLYGSIGSKARLIPEIERFLSPPSRSDGFFVDLFCGTGVVAASAAKHGWKVRLNDHLSCAVTLSAARIASERDCRFRSLGGYSAAVERLNSLQARAGFIASQYSPLSFEKVGIERRYFTTGNASKIDAVRTQIRRWSVAGKITPLEEQLLLADLILGANRVANIAGTYGCFLREWLPQALEPLHIVPRLLLRTRVEKQIFSRDARDVPVDPEDLVYIDPPYTKRQYAAIPSAGDYSGGR